MKIFIISAALVFATVGGFAADKAKVKEPPGTPVNTETVKSPDKQPGQERKVVEWPRPYKPSEEISADSTVPFPTDI